MSFDSSVPEAFSRAAETYSDTAEVQALVAKHLCGLISPAEVLDGILELGCGSGFLSEELLRKFPSASLLGVDNAPEMLHVASHRCSNPRAKWLAADACHLNLEKQFEIIVSSSALHWMRPYETIFRIVRDHLAENGVVYLAVMLKGTLSELHTLRAQITDLPARENLPCKKQLEVSIEKAGLETITYSEERFVQKHENALSFFRDLKRAGLTGGVFSRGSRLLTRGELRTLCEEYQKRHSAADSKVLSSYQVGFFTLRAKK